MEMRSTVPTGLAGAFLAVRTANRCCYRKAGTEANGIREYDLRVDDLYVLFP